MAVNTTHRKQDFALDVQTLARQTLEIYQKIKALHSLYTDLGLSFADADFTGIGGMEHVDAATFNAALTSFIAIESLMDTNHRANLNRL